MNQVVIKKNIEVSNGGIGVSGSYNYANITPPLNLMELRIKELSDSVTALILEGRKIEFTPNYAHIENAIADILCAIKDLEKFKEVEND